MSNTDEFSINADEFRELMTPHCIVPGCERRAAFVPQILLWQSKFGLSKPRDRSFAFKMPHAPHCIECKAIVTLEMFLTDQSWELIVKKFEKAGLTPPRRWTAQLEWLQLELPEVSKRG